MGYRSGDAVFIGGWWAYIGWSPHAFGVYVLGCGFTVRDARHTVAVFSEGPGKVTEDPWFTVGHVAMRFGRVFPIKVTWKGARR